MCKNFIKSLFPTLSVKQLAISSSLESKKHTYREQHYRRKPYSEKHRHITGKCNIFAGYSHDIIVKIPSDINVTPEKPNLIVIQGEDKERIGTFASRIISFRTTEPYKGKGIKYQGQYILRKEGKKK